MSSSVPSPSKWLTIVTTVLSVAWGGILAYRHLEGHASVLDRLEAPLVDLRVLISGPRPAPESLVIVALDDAVVQNAGSYPLPRRTIAQLVRTLHNLNPRALAVDILFLDPGLPEDDRDLSSALQKARAVVAAAAIFPKERDRLEPSTAVWADLPSAERILLPISALRNVTGFGVVNIATDSAGTPRHIPLVVRIGETIVPSFPLRVASIATRSDPLFDGDRLTLGSVETMTDLGRNLPLRFYGPRGAIRTISAERVMRGNIDAQEISDRIVIIGATAIGTGDTFATPFDPVFPGVEVLATAIGHLTSGDGLVRSRATRRIDAVAAISLPAVTVLLVVLRHIGIGLAILALVVASWTLIAILAFHHGIWLSMIVPMAAVMPPAMFYITARLWLDRRAERQLLAGQANLRRFHPPALADHLVRTAEFLAAPVQQAVAVLFIDLTGFTGLSERLGPARTRTLLKEFHTLVEDVVTRHEGLVMTYMGDGAMIVFGIPEARTDDATRAAQSAVALAEAAKSWIDHLPEGSATDVRIGAHYGPVVVSRLGADTHQHITATGDSVNVASRLLEVAAQCKAVIAFSADLLERARFPVPPGLSEETEVSIRGRSQALKVRHWRPLDS